MASPNDSGTSPNRSRAFDFNSFASELFNSIQVRKSSDAQTDEGSLGATVDLPGSLRFWVRRSFVEVLSSAR